DPSGSASGTDPPEALRRVRRPGLDQIRFPLRAATMPTPRSASARAPRPYSGMVGTSIVHLAEQPSPGVVLPSSHCSLHSTSPLPQTGSWQALSQQSLSILFWSSHCSTPAWTKPSPHEAFVQLFRQLSLLSWLPSSHCSEHSTMPLPH